MLINKNRIASILLNIFVFSGLSFIFIFFASSALAQDPTIQVNEGQIGFKIPDLGDILTFAIRAFFVIAGLSALFYLLLGAFAWVTSGGDKDAISGARDKIQAAVLGMILIVAVLAIIVTLETIVFRKKICLGISCPVSIPSLVKSGCIPDPTDESKCCASGVIGYATVGDGSSRREQPERLVCCRKVDGYAVLNPLDDKMCNIF